VWKGLRIARIGEPGMRIAYGKVEASRARVMVSLNYEGD
jgi:hypothetical protein